MNNYPLQKEYHLLTVFRHKAASTLGHQIYSVPVHAAGRRMACPFDSHTALQGSVLAQASSFTCLLLYLVDSAYTAARRLPHPMRPAVWLSLTSRITHSHSHAMPCALRRIAKAVNCTRCRRPWRPMAATAAGAPAPSVATALWVPLAPSAPCQVRNVWNRAKPDGAIDFLTFGLHFSTLAFIPLRKAASLRTSICETVPQFNSPSAPVMERAIANHQQHFNDCQLSECSWATGGGGGGWGGTLDSSGGGTPLSEAGSSSGRGSISLGEGLGAEYRMGVHGGCVVVQCCFVCLVLDWPCAGAPARTRLPFCCSVGFCIGLGEGMGAEYRTGVRGGCVPW